MMKFDVEWKQFKLNILMLLSIENCVTEGKNWCFTKCVRKSYMGLHLHRCKPISLKLGMMIVTTVLFILIPVWITLTFIQVDRDMKKQNLLHQLSGKLPGCYD